MITKTSNKLKLMCEEVIAMIDPECWGDDSIFTGGENVMGKVANLSKNKKEKIIMDKNTRVSLLKYLNNSKNLIQNVFEEKELENQCNKLIDKFRMGKETVYYLDKNDFIEAIKGGKWFRSGVYGTYACKIQHFDNEIYEFSIGYCYENNLFSEINRIDDNNWFIGDDLLYHINLRKQEGITIDEQEEDDEYKIKEIYNDIDKIDEDKLINYILNLDMLKGKQFLSKEEYYDILNKLKNNDINDLPQLDIYIE